LCYFQKFLWYTKNIQKRRKGVMEDIQKNHHLIS
jgi:hypothetical protein